MNQGFEGPAGRKPKPRSTAPRGASKVSLSTPPKSYSPRCGLAVLGAVSEMGQNLDAAVGACALMLQPGASGRWRCRQELAHELFKAKALIAVMRADPLKVDAYAAGQCRLIQKA